MSLAVRFDVTRAPVIWLLFVIQVPDASNKGVVPVTFFPCDRFMLSLACLEHMVRVIFDDIIVDGGTLRPAFGTRLHVNVRHP